MTPSLRFSQFFSPMAQACLLFGLWFLGTTYPNILFLKFWLLFSLPPLRAPGVLYRFKTTLYLYYMKSYSFSSQYNFDPSVASLLLFYLAAFWILFIFCIRNSTKMCWTWKRNNRTQYLLSSSNRNASAQHSFIFPFSILSIIYYLFFLLSFSDLLDICLLSMYLSIAIYVFTFLIFFIGFISRKSF